MPKANEKEVIIAVQRSEYLQFTSLHIPSSLQNHHQNAIHSNPTNHLHSFIILDDDLTLPLHTVIWAKQHGKFQASLSAWDFCVSGSCYLYYLSLREDTVLVHGMIWSETGLSKLILPRNKTIIKQHKGVHNIIDSNPFFLVAIILMYVQATG